MSGCLILVTGNNYFFFSFFGFFRKKKSMLPVLFMLRFKIPNWILRYFELFIYLLFVCLFIWTSLNGFALIIWRPQKKENHLVAASKAVLWGHGNKKIARLTLLLRSDGVTEWQHCLLFAKGKKKKKKEVQLEQTPVTLKCLELAPSGTTVVMLAGRKRSWDLINQLHLPGETML